MVRLVDLARLGVLERGTGLLRVGTAGQALAIATAAALPGFVDELHLQALFPLGNDQLGLTQGVVGLREESGDALGEAWGYLGLLLLPSNPKLLGVSDGLSLLSESL